MFAEPGLNLLPLIAAALKSEEVWPMLSEPAEEENLRAAF